MTQSSSTDSLLQLKDGLWTSNQALVALLGLCPLLAVSNSTVNGLGLGLATLFVMSSSAFLASCLRPWIHEDVRLPVFVLLIATLVTITELVLHAWRYELYRSLGIFLPLIVTNCAILARIEAHASRQPQWQATLNAMAMGSGFLLVLLLLGMARELVGTGSLFSNMNILLGENWGSGGWTLLPGFDGFLPALLAPGAFIGLALMVALKQKLDARP